MKINLLVGARFNGKIVSDAYHELGLDARIYTSSPAKNWQNRLSPGKREVRFVPLLSGIWQGVTGLAPGRGMKDMSAVLFDRIASRTMRPCDVLHFWATFGLHSARRQKRLGGKAVLDRACPHIQFQEDLITEEADALGFRFDRSSRAMIDRCLEEYEIADRIIVPSQYSYRTFVERGIPASRMEIIRLDSNFTPRGQYPVDRGGRKGFVLGCVGGSFLRKGIVYLVEAWQKLGLPDGKLLLKMPAQELQRHPGTWRKIVADPSIEVVERLEDMEGFYRRCDLFCLPSTDDGFGMVVLEAIACGVPVLVTENVGAADMVEEGRTGFILPARRADPLAEKIQLLHDDPTRLAEMSANCLAYYRGYRQRKESYPSKLKQLLDSMGAGRAPHVIPVYAETGRCASASVQLLAGSMISTTILRKKADG